MNALVDALLQGMPKSTVRFRSGFRHEVSARDYCPFHDHDAAEIVFHASGRGITRLSDGECVAFREGCAVIYGPLQAHDQQLSQDGVDVCVLVDLPAPLPRLLGRCLVTTPIDDPLVVTELEALATAPPVQDEAERAMWSYRATAALIHLLARTDGGQGAVDVGIAARARRHIQERFRDIGSLDEVSTALGVSASHLRARFTERYGQSMVAWLTEVRLARARELLAHSPMPVRDIAAMCGFASVHYFTTVFRKHVGVPPGRFRDG